MTDHDADKALRALFQEAGAFTAPEGMEARILQRLAATPQAAPIPEKPLLPGWSWVAGGLLLAGAIVSGATHGGSSAAWMDRLLPARTLDGVLGSPWLVMALASGVLLLALHTWLNARLHAPRLR